MTIRRMTIRALARPLLFAVALLGGCASSPPRTAERPQRVSDSAPDKIAATRAAAGLHLEEDDQRWGIEEARARKQRSETHAAATAPAVTAPTPTTPPQPAPATPTPAPAAAPTVPAR